jgi:hypothetical protein
MRQTLHIFKKDVRHLRLEIIVTLLMAAAFAFVGSNRAKWLTEPATSRSTAWFLLQFLLPLTWFVLIARVIHAEAIAGDRQFWTTRPYAWKSLLAAKALFILTFVNVPLLIADTLILSAHGLNPIAAIPGMFWNQILVFGTLILPIASLCALTAGLVQLLLTIVVLALALVAWNIVVPGMGALPYWLSLQWIRNDFGTLIVGTAGLAILIWQYATRRTTIARWASVTIISFAVVALFSLPWTAAYALQSKLSHSPVLSSSVQPGFDPSKLWAIRACVQKDDTVRILLPLRFTGIAEEFEPWADGLVISIEAPDGTLWRSANDPWWNISQTGQLWSLQTTISGQFYRKIKDSNAETPRQSVRNIVGRSERDECSRGGPVRSSTGWWRVSGQSRCKRAVCVLSL